MPAPPDPGVLWIAAVGDIQLGPSVPEDPALGPLRRAAPVLSAADLAIGNLEGPLTTRAPAKCRPGSATCFAFTTPPHAAAHLAGVGLDVLSLVNNHALDAGPAGRDETEAALRTHGVEPVSGFRPATLQVRARGAHARPVRIAVLGFATAAHSPDLRRADEVAAHVGQAARDHDIVLVIFHGGAEGPDAVRVPYGTERFLGEDRGDLRTFARRAIDAGADLVVGSGPHVLRGMEVYRGRLIAYSLGNFAGGGRLSTHGVRQHTGVLLACLDAATGAFLGGAWRSFRLDPQGEPHPDPTGAAAELLARLSLEDFGWSAAAVERDGTIRAPDEIPETLHRAATASDGGARASADRRCGPAPEAL